MQHCNVSSALAMETLLFCIKPWTWRGIPFKQLETLGGVLSTMAADSLALKHRAIGILSTNRIFIVLPKYYIYSELYFEKKNPVA